MNVVRNTPSNGRLRMSVPASEIVEDPTIMGGAPTVRGTRVPAETIVLCLREGSSDSEIFLNYPTLPVDGIHAVRRWAAERGMSVAPDKAAPPG